MITVQEAALEDISAIGNLVQDVLGYTGLDLERLRGRFEQMTHSDIYKTFVAKKAGDVIGFIGLCEGLTFELDGTYLRIISFAVSADYQHLGIGSKLIARAERYAHERDIHCVLVSSGLQRSDAHRFYEQKGFIKKGYSYKKELR